jgi:hypothetical protein
MLMTTSKLIALRVFCLTFGRSVQANRFFRWFIVEFLVRKKNATQSYNASSKFFVMSDLEK